MSVRSLHRVTGRLSGHAAVILAILAIAVAMHALLGLRMMRAPKIEFGDGIEYLDAAYHLYRDLTYTSAPEPSAPPAVGREPGYPAFLAVLMGADAGLASYEPRCGGSVTACDPQQFRILSVANLVLIEVTSLLLATLAYRMTGRGGAALVAGGYVLLNINLLRSHWYDPMSDELALALVALAMLALQAAWARKAPLRWFCVGLAFAALSLTKAVFLPFSFGLAAAAVGSMMLCPGAMRRWGPGLLIASAVYLALVGGWIGRNWQVSGMPRFTDERGGIALSNREVFDHMTPSQVLAAFVYWTPGGGEAFARHLFSPDTVAPFDLYAPGGFYDRGQNGYGRSVEALMQTEGLERPEAVAKLDRTIVGEILAAPLGFAVSTVPLLYRGLWIDQFALAGLPLLVWRLRRAWTDRNGLLISLLAFGLFNELFYTVFSLNIPRYQITAIPALALAAALASVPVIGRLRRRPGADRPLAAAGAGASQRFT